MRLFVALDLPWELRERLMALSGHGIPGARWVPAENYHLTLRFIGETPAWQAEEIDLALAGLKARGFPLTMTGLGTFSKGGRATALWVGVERTPALDHLRVQDRDGAAAGGSGAGAAAVCAACDLGPAGQCGGGAACLVPAGAQSVPGAGGAGGALHAVQLPVGEGAGGLHAGGGVFAGVSGKLKRTLGDFGACQTYTWAFRCGAKRTTGYFGDSRTGTSGLNFSTLRSRIRLSG